METMGKAKSVIYIIGRVLNEGISLLVFTLLDLLDTILCMVYKITDFIMEAEWSSCYCSSSSAKKSITQSGKILVSEKGESAKIVRLTSSSKLQLEDISDTLFTRPSLLSDLAGRLIQKLKLIEPNNVVSIGTNYNNKKKGGKTTFTVESTNNIVQMLQGKMGGKPSLLPCLRWSDCDCRTCASWMASPSTRNELYVHVDGAKGDIKGTEDVLFIHGFISSSKFWTETLFPNFRKETKSKYRLFAVDLLGFGRSPKPRDSLYTLRDHVEMIEKSVLENNKVTSFHVVAHSLGCILAFALAVRHPDKIKSLTLIAPPYFGVAKGMEGKETQYVLRRVAPRRVWPLMAFGASITCWYEHISRTICLLLNKNHRLWEFLTKLLTRNRIRTYLVEGFFCHTHNSSWHTLHNIIFGAANKLEKYLDFIGDRLNCNVTIFHGKDDELLPVECSYNVQSRISRAQVKVVDNKDHITIVVGRQKTFARELEAIWASSSSSPPPPPPSPPASN